jgi:hypothetical protein
MLKGTPQLRKHPVLMVGEDIRYFIDVGNIEAHPKIEYDTYMDRILLIDYKY